MENTANIVDERVEGFPSQYHPALSELLETSDSAFTWYTERLYQKIGTTINLNDYGDPEDLREDATVLEGFGFLEKGVNGNTFRVHEPDASEDDGDVDDAGGSGNPVEIPEGVVLKEIRWTEAKIDCFLEVARLAEEVSRATVHDLKKKLEAAGHGGASNFLREFEKAGLIVCTLGQRGGKGVTKSYQITRLGWKEVVGLRALRAGLGADDTPPPADPPKPDAEKSGAVATAGGNGFFAERLRILTTQLKWPESLATQLLREEKVRIFFESSGSCNVLIHYPGKEESTKAK